ncbi:efflux transporter periplasmic adaptor subunit, partial [Francisella tularensis subsp. holarctica]|nr:efflux transporter periplasmic adaptor subunit [Francisella tularensis subsp. holarctica]
GNKRIINIIFVQKFNNGENQATLTTKETIFITIPVPQKKINMIIVGQQKKINSETNTCETIK